MVWVPCNWILFRHVTNTNYKPQITRHTCKSLQQVLTIWQCQWQYTAKKATIWLLLITIPQENAYVKYTECSLGLNYLYNSINILKWKNWDEGIQWEEKLNWLLMPPKGVRNAFDASYQKFVKNYFCKCFLHIFIISADFHIWN